MSYWKFGCKWAGGNSFYDIIKRAEIVIGVKEEVFEEGSYILITEGFLVKAIAIVLEAPKKVATDNGIVDSLKKHIPLEDLEQRVTFARAKWYELNESEQFEYKVQRGMCEIHEKDIISKVNNIVGKRLVSNGQVLLNDIDANDLLLGKKQIIFYGPPGTGKTYNTKQMAIELLDGIALEDSYSEISNSTESDKNVWIFQANPNKYDIFGALSDPNYIKNDWSINQHRHRIKEGDIALLWASGDKAGIYAMFEIISNPAMTIEEDYDRKFWKSEEDKGIPKLRVKMKLIKNLINNPISKDELKAINGLENLSIFKFFQGTNFPVDKDEWQIIKDKIEERR